MDAKIYKYIRFDDHAARGWDGEIIEQGGTAAKESPAQVDADDYFDDDDWPHL